MSDPSRPVCENEALCEILKLALDRAPDAEGKAAIQAILDRYCGGVVMQDDSGGTTPPGRGR